MWHHLSTRGFLVRAPKRIPKQGGAVEAAAMRIKLLSASRMATHVLVNATVLSLAVGFPLRSASADQIFCEDFEGAFPGPLH
ncbi:MAG: hypothetical protein ACE5EX_02695, partial [Phycisphaerae bacterium]